MLVDTLGLVTVVSVLPAGLLLELLCVPSLLVLLDLLGEALVDLDLDVLPPGSDPRLGLLLEFLLDQLLSVLRVRERVGDQTGSVVQLERDKVSVHVRLERGRADQVIESETRDKANRSAQVRKEGSGKRDCAC